MNAVDILKYGQQMVLQAIDGFPETAWETPGACGVWSVKDIIAHLASYERVLVDILTTFTRSGATPALNTFLELGGQFNDSEVNRCQFGQDLSPISGRDRQRLIGWH